MTALRTLQRAPGHEFSRVGTESGRFSARIGAHGAVAEVELAEGRIAITPVGADAGAFGLRTVHVGRQRAAPDTACRLPPLHETRARGQEAVLARDGIEERYLAGPLGLEQSYLIDARPPGAGPLAIEVAFDGLSPTLADGKGVVRLFDAGGATRAVYRELAAVDADGRELVAWMEVGGGSVTLVVADEGAAYPVLVDPLIVTEQAKVTASDGVSWDRFGTSLSVSGDTAVVGAYAAEIGANSQQGAAYVFVRSGALWIEQAKLAASDGVSGDWFGFSVSVSGETAVIGAPMLWASARSGAAYVFVRSGTTWTEQAELTASDAGPDDFLGTSVSVSGDTTVVGAAADDIGANSRQGSSYVFVRAGTTWSEEAKLTASDGATEDFFGFSVSVSGDTAVVGAETAAVGANLSQGAAYIFARTGTTWTEEAKLTASDGAQADWFGSAVSLSGQTALVGARFSDAGANLSQGAAYVFVRNGSAWTEEAKLTASDGAPDDLFGGSVGVAGETAVVGAWGAGVGGSAGQGAAYVFLRSGTSWSEAAKLTASDGASRDWLSSSLGVSGNTVVLGAAGAVIGAAYVFLLDRPLGVPCSTDLDCLSGLCADHVCCDTPCDGACDACSIAAGAPLDGSCAPVTGPPCDDGDACTRLDSCQAGVCTGGTPVSCPATDLCHDPGSCDPLTGGCSDPAKADGSPCDDSDACTQIDACLAGACAGSSPVVCSASDACHDAGSCDASTGLCSDPPKPDGTGCDDGDACTRTDACQGGACTGLDPVVCTASEQCHEVGSCDPASGLCSDPWKPDGTGCDDGDACTGTDTCQAGACASGLPLPCSASDPCHDAGSCDPATGACSDPPSADGSACDDGDPCTRTDSCRDGACTGLDPVVCPASDPCHDAGSCDPATGTCTAPFAPDGTACDDGSDCTTADSCSEGACVGTQVVCPEPDECHEAATCLAWKGICWGAPRADGTPCSLGACSAGVCAAAPPADLPDASTDGSPTADGGCGCGAAGSGAGNSLALLLSVVLLRASKRCRSLARRDLAASRRAPGPRSATVGG